MVSKWVINLLKNGVYWGYNPVTNHLISSSDIQVERCNYERIRLKIENNHNSPYGLPRLPENLAQGIWKTNGAKETNLIPRIRQQRGSLPDQLWWLRHPVENMP